MNQKIIITGPPKSGKSTLISRLISYYSQKDIKIEGFITPEVIDKNKRIGFDAIDINSKNKVPLARIGDYKTRYTLGRYHVFIKEFEHFIVKLERIEEQDINLIIIDEIGKMELLSRKFQKLIRKLFNLKVPLIATIGQRLQHPLKQYILMIPNIEVINLNHRNQEAMFQKIIALVKT